MSQSRLVVGVFVLFTVAGSSYLRAEDDKLLGTWTHKGKEGGHDQFWLIQKDGDKWTVKGWYKKDGAETGAFIGEEVKYADGALSYVHKYVKKPSEKFVDNVPATLKPEGDGLRYTYASGTTKGSRLLVKFKEEPKAVAKEAPKAEGNKEDKLLGRWIGSVDGFDQLWTIKFADGAWSVEGTYTKGGVEAGSFVGVQVKVVDGDLTYVRKYVKKPSSAWPDSPPVLVKLDGDVLIYSYKLDTFKGDRVLKRYKEGAKVEPKTVAKDAAKLEDFAGNWEADYDGMKVVWQIIVKDGKVEVSTNYYSKAKANALVGNWVAVSPEFKDGKLLFTAKYTKKIPGYSDGKSFVCTLQSQDVLQYHYTNTGENQGGTVRRVKK